MSHPPPHRYISDGIAKGFPGYALRAAVARSVETESRGGAPILTLGHLAHLSGAPYLYLRQVVQRVTDPYIDITRPKKTGGMRAISSPEPVLMDVQRLILRRALEGMQLHSASFAYRKNRSIILCAKRHIGARWLMKFDLHDFFGYISEYQVHEVFRARGYQPLIALELARLCTRSSHIARRGGRPSRYASIPSYDSDAPGHLPQGGPASGALSNAVAASLDGAIMDLSLKAGFTYTRYSDDIVLSTSDHFNRNHARSVIREMRRTVSEHGFRLHEKKTRVVPPGARHVVLGLLLGEEVVRLPPEYRRRVEVHVRGVAKFGLLEHVEHRGYDSILSFISHVDGCLAFAAAVEAGWAAKMAYEWREALSAQGFPSESDSGLG